MYVNAEGPADGEVRIRIASATDAEALAALAARTFRDTFQADNTPADMDAYVGTAFHAGRLRAELNDEASTFLLAFPGGVGPPIGYAKLRRGTSEPSVIGPNPVELERLYVDRPALGRGVGAALMRTALDTARRAGYQTIWLGVWERNPRAIAFYRQWAFEPVGTHVFRLGSDDQTDLVMARQLTSRDG